MASGDDVDDVHKQEILDIKASEILSDLMSKHEHILNSKDSKFNERIEALIITWAELDGLDKFKVSQCLSKLVEYVKHHTLDVILSMEYNKYKGKYKHNLSGCILICGEGFRIIAKPFCILCKKMAQIALDPWGKDTIRKMLNNKCPLSHELDYLYFTNEESGYLISMRLKVLCHSNCEDLALNLTRAYIKCCEWSTMNNCTMQITEDQRRFIMDVYITLLFRYEMNQEMTSMLKGLSIEEGIHTVKRFTKKVANVWAIWEDSTSIAQLSATIYLTKVVLNASDQTSAQLTELIDVWLPTFQTDEEDLEILITYCRSIVKCTLHAEHIYLFANKLVNIFGNKLLPFVVELYIQALNTDLNVVEKLKIEETVILEDIENKHECISEGLLQLGILLIDNVRIARECILSSFSLKPTKDVLKRIEELARASGCDVVDTGQWACKYHPAAKTSDDLLIFCEECQDYKSQLQLATKFFPNASLTDTLKEDSMGLRQDLCDDLVVVIFCARYQILNWTQNWSDLHVLCVMYLNDPERTKNFVTELKFLEVDYSKFLMKKEFYHYVGYNDDALYELPAKKITKKRRKRKLSDSDEDYESESLSTPKSNPETLKTLRSFRRTLKRKFVDHGDNSDADAESPPHVDARLTMAQMQQHHANATPTCSNATQRDYTSSSSANNLQTPSNVIKVREDMFPSYPAAENSGFAHQQHYYNERTLDQVHWQHYAQNNTNFSHEPVIQNTSPTSINNNDAHFMKDLSNGDDTNKLMCDFTGEYAEGEYWDDIPPSPSDISIYPREPSVPDCNEDLLKDLVDEIEREIMLTDIPAATYQNNNGIPITAHPTASDGLAKAKKTKRKIVNKTLIAKLEDAIGASTFSLIAPTTINDESNDVNHLEVSNYLNNVAPNYLNTSKLVNLEDAPNYINNANNVNLDGATNYINKASNVNLKSAPNYIENTNNLYLEGATNYINNVNAPNYINNASNANLDGATNDINKASNVVNLKNAPNYIENANNANLEGATNYMNNVNAPNYINNASNVINLEGASNYINNASNIINLEGATNYMNVSQFVNMEGASNYIDNVSQFVDVEGASNTINNASVVNLGAPNNINNANNLEPGVLNPILSTTEIEMASNESASQTTPDQSIIIVLDSPITPITPPALMPDFNLSDLCLDLDASDEPAVDLIISSDVDILETSGEDDIKNANASTPIAATLIADAVEIMDVSLDKDYARKSFDAIGLQLDTTITSNNVNNTSDAIRLESNAIIKSNNGGKSSSNSNTSIKSSYSGKSSGELNTNIKSNSSGKSSGESNTTIKSNYSGKLFGESNTTIKSNYGQKSFIDLKLNTNITSNNVEKTSDAIRFESITIIKSNNGGKSSSESNTTTKSNYSGKSSGESNTTIKSNYSGKSSDELNSSNKSNLSGKSSSESNTTIKSNYSGKSSDELNSSNKSYLSGKPSGESNTTTKSNYSGTSSGESNKSIKSNYSAKSSDGLNTKIKPNYSGKSSSESNTTIQSNYSGKSSSESNRSITSNYSAKSSDELNTKIKPNYSGKSSDELNASNKSKYSGKSSGKSNKSIKSNYSGKSSDELNASIKSNYSGKLSDKLNTSNKSNHGGKSSGELNTSINSNYDQKSFDAICHELNINTTTKSNMGQKSFIDLKLNKTIKSNDGKRSSGAIGLNLNPTIKKLSDAIGDAPNTTTKSNYGQKSFIDLKLNPTSKKSFDGIGLKLNPTIKYNNSKKSSDAIRLELDKTIKSNYGKRSLGAMGLEINPTIKSNIGKRSLSAIGLGLNPTIKSNNTKKSSDAIGLDLNKTIKSNDGKRSLGAMGLEINPTIKSKSGKRSLSAMGLELNPTIKSNDGKSSLGAMGLEINPTIKSKSVKRSLSAIGLGLNPTIKSNDDKRSLVAMGLEINPTIKSKSGKRSLSAMGLELNPTIKSNDGKRSLGAMGLEINPTIKSKSGKRSLSAMGLELNPTIKSNDGKRSLGAMGLEINPTIKSKSGKRSLSAMGLELNPTIKSNDGKRSLGAMGLEINPTIKSKSGKRSLSAIGLYSKKSSDAISLELNKTIKSNDGKRSLGDIGLELNPTIKSKSGKRSSIGLELNPTIKSNNAKKSSASIGLESNTTIKSSHSQKSFIGRELNATTKSNTGKKSSAAIGLESNATIKSKNAKKSIAILRKKSNTNIKSKIAKKSSIAPQLNTSIIIIDDDEDDDVLIVGGPSKQSKTSANPSNAVEKASKSNKATPNDTIAPIDELIVINESDSEHPNNAAPSSGELFKTLIDELMLTNESEALNNKSPSGELFEKTINESEAANASNSENPFNIASSSVGIFKSPINDLMLGEAARNSSHYDKSCKIVLSNGKLYKVPIIELMQTNESDAGNASDSENPYNNTSPSGGIFKSPINDLMLSEAAGKSSHYDKPCKIVLSNGKLYKTPIIELMQTNESDAGNSSDPENPYNNTSPSGGIFKSPINDLMLSEAAGNSSHYDKPCKIVLRNGKLYKTPIIELMQTNESDAGNASDPENPYNNASPSGGIFKSPINDLMLSEAAGNSSHYDKPCKIVLSNGKLYKRPINDLILSEAAGNSTPIIELMLTNESETGHLSDSNNPFNNASPSGEIFQTITPIKPTNEMLASERDPCNSSTIDGFKATNPINTKLLNVNKVRNKATQISVEIATTNESEAMEISDDEKVYSLTGNANSVAGKANSVAGKANAVAGKANAVAVKANAVAVKANLVAGKSNSVVGIAGKSNTVAGKANSVTGKANLVAVKSNSVAGKSNSFVGKSNSVVGIAGKSNTVAVKANPVAGKSILVAVKANSVAGKSNLVAGKANSVAGKSDSVAVKANLVAGISDSVAGKANSVAGKSILVAVKANAVAGKSDSVAVKANLVAGISNLVAVKANSVAGKSNSFVGKSNSVVGIAGKSNTVAVKANSVAGKSNSVVVKANSVAGKSNSVAVKANAVVGKANSVVGKANSVVAKANVPDDDDAPSDDDTTSEDDAISDDDYQPPPVKSINKRSINFASKPMNKLDLLWKVEEQYKSITKRLCNREFYDAPYEDKSFNAMPKPFKVADSCEDQESYSDAGSISSDDDEPAAIASINASKQVDAMETSEADVQALIAAKPIDKAEAAYSGHEPVLNFKFFPLRYQLKQFNHPFSFGNQGEAPEQLVQTYVAKANEHIESEQTVVGQGDAFEEEVFMAAKAFHVEGIFLSATDVPTGAFDDAGADFAQEFIQETRAKILKENTDPMPNLIRRINKPRSRSDPGLRIKVLKANSPMAAIVAPLKPLKPITKRISRRDAVSNFNRSKLKYEQNVQLLIDRKKEQERMAAVLDDVRATAGKRITEDVEGSAPSKKRMKKAQHIKRPPPKNKQAKTKHVVNNEANAPPTIEMCFELVTVHVEDDLAPSLPELDGVGGGLPIPLISQREEYKDCAINNDNCMPSTSRQNRRNICEKKQFSSSQVDYKKINNIRECSVVLTELTPKTLAKCNKVNTIRQSNNNNKKRKYKAKTKRVARPKRTKSVRKKQRRTQSQPQTSSADNSLSMECENRIPTITWPLQQINKPNEADQCKQPPDECNPKVVIQRLKESSVQSLLSRVPGVHDKQFFRPQDTDQIVNVVQIAGRATSTVPAANTQTSTQVTPHIQRIGQPKTDKPEAPGTDAPASAVSKVAAAHNAFASKPASTGSPTLINILSQQIIRPVNQNKPRINILSHQTIRPMNNTASTIKTIDAQGNHTSRVIAAGEQILTPIRTGSTIKTVVGTSSSEQQQSRIVQFICKSTDGKLIPVTSFASSNRVVKVGTTQTLTPDSPNYDDSFHKNKIIDNSVVESSVVVSESSLPKFQQAFGKSVYQNNVEAINSTNTSTNLTNNDGDKKAVTHLKTTTVNIQPIQGGVIYTRQMPVGQTINLIQQPRGQVFRIATTNANNEILVKDTVIHSKMSALLAAALQGKPKPNGTDADADNNTTTRTLQLTTRPTLVQNARIVKPVPSNVIRTAATAANAPQAANLSSTTLEQLREFDMVYKQVKERSSTSTPSEANSVSEGTEAAPAPQRISVTYLNQGGQKINCSPLVVVSSYNNLQSAASPALSVASQGSSSPCVTPASTPTPTALPKIGGKSSKGKSVKSPPTVTNAAKTSPLPKPQQKPQEDEHTTQRIFDILAEYAEQLRNSPDLNNKPAPRRRSNPPTNPSQNSKRKKSSGKKGGCSTDADLDGDHTIGSEDSSCGVVQLSMQDDEQMPTTASTSESNDSISTQVTTQQQRPPQLILTDSSNNTTTRNLIIADSNVGEALKMPNTAVLVPGNYIMPVSMVKGGQQIAVVSGGSKILATVPARNGPNMLLFQSFLNQNRSGKTNVPTTLKYSTLQPITGISSQTLTGVSAQPPVILPQGNHGMVTLGQSISIKKICDEHSDSKNNTELLLTISQSRETNCTGREEPPRPDSSSGSTCLVKVKIENEANEDAATGALSDAFKFHKQIATQTNATPVIAQVVKKETAQEQDTSNAHAPTQTTIMTIHIENESAKDAQAKPEERVQSVLVTAGSSNGPMLSHSPPKYKQSDCNESSTDQTKEYMRNGSGQRSNDVKAYHHPSHATFSLQGKIKKISTGVRHEKELQQRKQAAIERELRLQKSLSEECEDLGVDEPSTSDLFPDNDIIFEANHSPSFDQNSLEMPKRIFHHSLLDTKEDMKQIFTYGDCEYILNDLSGEIEAKLMSGRKVADQAVCDKSAKAVKAANAAKAAKVIAQAAAKVANAVNACGDSTLLQTSTSMSDVTLCSPISPEQFPPSSPPPVNKYMHKYTNRKKDRLKQIENWTTAEVSSSEDTTCSTELVKCSALSPADLCNKHDDEELSQLSNDAFKVVRVSVKSECGEIHCSEDADCSLSGRGARKTVKKLCSCCNNRSEDVLMVAASRKRALPQPAAKPHIKTFPPTKKS